VVSAVARRAGLKVALSGLGGDEIFGGYPSFRRLTPIMPAVRQWSRMPRPMRRAAADLVRAVGGGAVTASKAAAVLESDGTMAAIWPITRQVFSNEERRALLPPSQWPSATRDSYYSLLSATGSNTTDDIWESVSYAESRTYMHDVLLRDTDQMSMAHALEVRVPLLDHRLVEYVASLPATIKAGRYPKSLLVESLPLPLPSTSTDRPKRGFTLPFDPWMRGALAPLCARALGPSGLDGRTLFQPGEITKLWQRFIDRRPGVTWSRVWTLVVLNHWLDRHGIEGANRP
jgi:asparagine synthase (glutamine-hydrolysing)